MVAKLLIYSELNKKCKDNFEKNDRLAFASKEKSLLLFADKGAFSEWISCRYDEECVSLFRKRMKERINGQPIDK